MNRFRSLSLSLIGLLFCAQAALADPRNDVLSGSIKNDLPRVESGLKSGANPNIFDANGNSPLSFAVRNQNVELVKLLLSHQADPNLSSSVNLQFKDWTPLHFACSQKNLEIAELLLKSGANINALTAYRPEDYKTQGKTALHLAVQANNLDMLKLLLSHKADPNVLSTGNETAQNWTALHLAVENGQLDIVNELLQHGANPNLAFTRMGDFSALVNRLNWHPLDQASFLGNQEILNALIASGAKNSSFMFHNVISNGNVHMLQSIIDAKIDVNTHEIDQPLVEVLRSNIDLKIRHQMLDILLKAGASPDQVSAAYTHGSAHEHSEPIPALSVAIQYDDIESVKRLLKAGADVSRSYEIHLNTLNALDMALDTMNPEILNLILDQFQNIKSDHLGNNQLMHLISLKRRLYDTTYLAYDLPTPEQLKQFSVIEKILDGRIQNSLQKSPITELRHLNSGGQTPFGLAVLNWQFELAQKLVNKGVLDKGNPLPENLIVDFLANSYYRFYNLERFPQTPQEILTHVKYLIKLGFKTQVKNEYGESALSYAQQSLSDQKALIQVLKASK